MPKCLNEKLVDAACFKENEKIEILLKKGADPNYGRGTVKFPLGMTAYGKNVQGAELLIKAGADLCAWNEDHTLTLFHNVAGWATLENHEIIDLFIKYDKQGHVYTLKNVWGKTPFMTLPPNLREYYEKKQVEESKNTFLARFNRFFNIFQSPDISNTGTELSVRPASPIHTNQRKIKVL